jgi:hypothetical protein
MSKARDLAGIFNLGPRSGTTAQRPATAEVGDIFYNGTTGKTEIYTTTGWKEMASGIPFGNTAARPAAVQGQPYFNGETQRLELFTGTSWENIVQEVPGVASISGNYSEATDSGVITIYGTNFVNGAYATAIGANGVQINAVSTVYNSLVQLTATFTGLSNAQEPYDIKVTNPSNLFGIIPDALYVNASPVWVTSSGSLGTFTEQVSFTVSALSATDSDSTITYALASGSTLPTGVTLNSATGVISGTLPDISTSTTYNFTINATDGVNVIPRAFSITSVPIVSSIELLVVGGGGGGGAQVGGGGGAGGLLYGSNYSLATSSYLVTVGAGGAGSGQSPANPGNYGSASFFGSLSAFGGGGGGAHTAGNRPASGDDGITGGLGRPGGSGGGGGGDNTSTGRPGGSSTQTSYSGVTSYGHNGGQGRAGDWAGGGGGGAGSAGSNSPSASTGGVGGSGREYSITGTAQFYAAGGGGCYNNSGGTTGRASGVGGAGNGDTPNSGRDGVANTGSGGGGIRDVGSSGNGAAGVVVIAYPDTFAPIRTIPGTLTYDQPSRAGYRVYRFTSGSGTVTF